MAITTSVDVKFIYVVMIAFPTYKNMVLFCILVLMFIFF